MSRYYILTESEGLGLIEATAVDESHPFSIGFIGMNGVASFDRHDLVWWSSVESALPGPFENLHPRHQHHPHHSGPGVFGVHPVSSRDFHDEFTREAKRRADLSRCSAAALSALTAAVVSRVPADWRNAILELKVSYELLARRYRVTHVLRNPVTDANAADFSDLLFAAIEVFHRIEVEGGQNWNRCTITFCKCDDGQWGADVNRQRGTDFAQL